VSLFNDLTANLQLFSHDQTGAPFVTWHFAPTPSRVK
jgi:hypothetical protein